MVIYDRQSFTDFFFSFSLFSCTVKCVICYALLLSWPKKCRCLLFLCVCVRLIAFYFHHSQCTSNPFMTFIFCGKLLATWLMIFDLYLYVQTPIAYIDLFLLYSVVFLFQIYLKWFILTCAPWTERTPETKRIQMKMTIQMTYAFSFRRPKTHFTNHSHAEKFYKLLTHFINIVILLVLLCY